MQSVSAVQVVLQAPVPQTYGVQELVAGVDAAFRSLLQVAAGVSVDAGAGRRRRTCVPAGVLAGRRRCRCRSRRCRRSPRRWSVHWFSGSWPAGTDDAGAERARRARTTRRCRCRRSRSRRPARRCARSCTRVRRAGRAVRRACRSSVLMQLFGDAQSVVAVQVVLQAASSVSQAYGSHSDARDRPADAGAVAGARRRQRRAGAACRRRSCVPVGVEAARAGCRCTCRRCRRSSPPCVGALAWRAWAPFRWRRCVQVPSAAGERARLAGPRAGLVAADALLRRSRSRTRSPSCRPCRVGFSVQVPALQMLGATQSRVGGAGGPADRRRSCRRCTCRTGAVVGRARRRPRRCRPRDGVSVDPVQVAGRALRAADVLAAGARAVAGAVVAAGRGRGRRALRCDQRRPGPAGSASRSRRCRPARTTCRSPCRRCCSRRPATQKSESQSAFSPTAGRADRDLAAAHRDAGVAATMQSVVAVVQVVLQAAVPQTVRRAGAGRARPGTSPAPSQRPRRRQRRARAARGAAGACRPRRAGTRPAPLHEPSVPQVRGPHVGALGGGVGAVPAGTGVQVPTVPVRLQRLAGRRAAGVAADALLAVAGRALAPPWCRRCRSTFLPQTLPMQMYPATQSAVVAQLVLQLPSCRRRTGCTIAASPARRSRCRRSGRPPCSAPARARVRAARRCRPRTCGTRPAVADAVAAAGGGALVGALAERILTVGDVACRSPRCPAPRTTCRSRCRPSSSRPPARRCSTLHSASAPQVAPSGFLPQLPLMQLLRRDAVGVGRADVVQAASWRRSCRTGTARRTGSCSTLQVPRRRSVPADVRIEPVQPASAQTTPACR